jgi:glycine cleavage system H protein
VEKAMFHRVVPENAQPCLWVSAGLLTYKLCDRDFDCDHCPLDTALRGGVPVGRPCESVFPRIRDGNPFPEDRRYTAGHSWVQAVAGEEGRTFRLGLDAFAAAIIGWCQEIRWRTSKANRGETISEIDLGLGVLSVGAPLQCNVAAGNPALLEDPRRLVTAPYTEGWILDLVMDDPAQCDGLLTADAARRKTQLDFQRFRRRAAMQLLADATVVGPSLADGGELLTDLRQMLGGHAYLDLLRELIY